MMMRAVGGANLSALLDPKPVSGSSRRMWVILLGTALAAHLGVGVMLYHQKFSISEAKSVPTETEPTIVYLQPPEKLEPKPQPQQAPAPSTRLNTPEKVFESPVPPLETVISETTTAAQGHVISVTTSAPPESTGTAAVEVPPAPKSPPVITQPDWVQQPTAAQLLRAYPTTAIDRGITGSANISCLVRVNGTLTDCQVVSETPARMGFGRAAISLSRYFRMSPRTVDGQAVDGARVNVGLRFDLSD